MDNPSTPAAVPVDEVHRLATEIRLAMVASLMADKVVAKQSANLERLTEIALAAIEKDRATRSAPQPMSGMFDSLSVDAMWQDFCRTSDYRQALKWAQEGEAPGALFVAFRHGLWAALNPAAVAQPSAEPVLIENDSDFCEAAGHCLMSSEMDLRHQGMALRDFALPALEYARFKLLCNVAGQMKPGGAFVTFPKALVDDCYHVAAPAGAAEPTEPSADAEHAARKLARLWLTTHYTDDPGNEDIEALCWRILGQVPPGLEEFSRARDGAGAGEQPSEARPIWKGEFLDAALDRALVRSVKFVDEPAAPAPAVREPSEPVWKSEKEAMDAADDGSVPWRLVDAEPHWVEFKAWAVDHLGQGYSLSVNEGQIVDPVTGWAFAGFQAGRAALGSVPAVEGGEPSKLWLWQNFVGGRPEYWAFDNPYPVHLDCGDPQTLGEPCGYALFKPSRNGRPDVSEADVLRRIEASKKDGA